jgi:hypothetical protein
MDASALRAVAGPTFDAQTSKLVPSLAQLFESDQARPTGRVAEAMAPSLRGYTLQDVCWGIFSEL